MSIANSPQFIQNIFDLAGFEFVFEVLELKTEAPYIYTVIRFFLIPCIFVFFGDLILIQLMRFWSQYIFTEQFAVSCFRALRTAIWSDGSIDVSKIQHCKFDDYNFKEYLETEIYTVITVLFNNHFFRFNDEIIKAKIKQICSLFDSKAANKHFIFYIFDLILSSIVC
ncbi:hypothetical protein T552_00107 [Pneumocystis carinii B80]|uniref:Uncharacterized protein n=1 Tax=Pneumocystis carinii (strain B80) TaxID=1408658 RepID=A0A0W4ZSV6_PNEC8|nr:hypothetical protein T552_00107 [Pneumocystis carinii B80]KTW31465.1 hypothetical protein T552_00107 [Pneumocystis carinii B80]